MIPIFIMASMLFLSVRCPVTRRTRRTPDTPNMGNRKISCHYLFLSSSEFCSILFLNHLEVNQLFEVWGFRLLDFPSEVS